MHLLITICNHHRPPRGKGIYSMHFTITMPNTLFEAVYIPDLDKKLDLLKRILHNRGSNEDCFHLLHYAYTRSVHEKQFHITPQGDLLFPLYNKGAPLFVKCKPYRSAMSKPNQRFKFDSFLQEEPAVQSKNITSPIIEQFLKLNSLPQVGSFHTLCQRNRTRISGDSYQGMNEILATCISRSIRYAQANPSVIQVDYYQGNQQLEIPFLDSACRIQTHLVLIMRFENGTWFMPTVLRRKYLDSNKKLRQN